MNEFISKSVDPQFWEVGQRAEEDPKKFKREWRNKSYKKANLARNN